MLAKMGAQLPPLTAGRSLTGISVPLLAGWIVAAALSRTDLFTAPFWVLTYLVVVGIALFVWGAVTATKSRFRRRVRLGSPWTVVLEEVAFGVASFLLFSAFMGR